MLFLSGGETLHLGNQPDYGVDLLFPWNRIPQKKVVLVARPDDERPWVLRSTPRHDSNSQPCRLRPSWLAT